QRVENHTLAHRVGLELLPVAPGVVVEIAGLDEAALIPVGLCSGVDQADRSDAGLEVVAAPAERGDDAIVPEVALDCAGNRLDHPLRCAGAGRPGFGAERDARVLPGAGVPVVGRDDAGGGANAAVGSGVAPVTRVLRDDAGSADDFAELEEAIRNRNPSCPVA